MSTWKGCCRWPEGLGCCWDYHSSYSFTLSLALATVGATHAFVLQPLIYFGNKFVYCTPVQDPQLEVFPRGRRFVRSSPASRMVVHPALRTAIFIWAGQVTGGYPDSYCVGPISPSHIRVTYGKKTDFFPSSEAGGFCSI